jgi:hypothetical protein
MLFLGVKGENNAPRLCVSKTKHFQTNSKTWFSFNPFYDDSDDKMHKFMFCYVLLLNANACCVAVLG